MAWDQTADLEEGDTSDFDTVTTTGSATFTADAVAALNGNYGALITTSAGAVAYGILNGPVSETEISAEFMLDINSLSGTGQFTICTLTSDSPKTWAYIDLNCPGGGVYNFIAVGINDDNSNSNTGYFAITDGKIRVYVHVKKASGADVGDGTLRIYIDGVLKATVSNLDNDGLDIDNAIYGCVAALPAGMSGTFYMDDCRWNDEPSYFSTPDVARAIPQVVVPTVRIREIVANPVRAIAQVDPGTTRIREIVANVTRAIARVSALGTHQSFVTKILHALFKRYTFLAPEHIEIESNTGVLIAPFRDYELIADERETI